MPPDTGSHLLTTNRKALTINLDAHRYGTFAEIGAGQEVARAFFRAGGASGTVAKTISAYDMAFSDAIYGKSRRYVSRERLETMLDHEYSLLRERLWESRSKTTSFFVFANTVAALNYRGDNECHGWLGLRFQDHPEAEPSDLIIHVRMWDRATLLQQQAIGITGVNLLYAAFYQSGDPERAVPSLIENCGAERIEVDSIEFKGPAFTRVDHRRINLRLVQNELTNAVLFGPGGSVELASEVFHKKPVIIQRGSFRPVTRVNEDMMRCAGRLFEDTRPGGPAPVTTYELAMMPQPEEREVDYDDFLGRIDTLTALGHQVLVSNYFEYFRLSSYFRRFTNEPIGIVMGIKNLLDVYQEGYYDKLDGGILEAMGRLFKNKVSLLVYPRLADTGRAFEQEAVDAVAKGLRAIEAPRADDGAAVITTANLQVEPTLRHLHHHLLARGYIRSLDTYDPSVLDTFAGNVRRLIETGQPGWESSVPAPAVAAIKTGKLFGWNG
ncbi:MAG: TonB-dependent receptor [Opitutaceae bacterium]